MNIAAPHLAACFDYLTSQGIQFTARPPDFAGGVRWSVITDWSDHTLDGVMINAALAELRQE